MVASTQSLLLTYFAPSSWSRLNLTFRLFTEFLKQNCSCSWSICDSNKLNKLMLHNNSQSALRDFSSATGSHSSHQSAQWFSSIRTNCSSGLCIYDIMYHICCISDYSVLARSVQLSLYISTKFPLMYSVRCVLDVAHCQNFISAVCLVRLGEEWCSHKTRRSLCSEFCSAIITITNHQETGTVFTCDDLDCDLQVIADADGWLCLIVFYTITAKDGKELLVDRVSRWITRS